MCELGIVKRRGGLVLWMILLAGGGMSCSTTGTRQASPCVQVDAHERLVDRIPPNRPVMRVDWFKRASLPSIGKDRAGLAYSSEDGLTFLYLGLSSLRDNRTPVESLRVEIRVVGGRLPERWFLPKCPVRPRLFTHGDSLRYALRLVWNEYPREEQDSVHVALCARTVDRAGNFSECSDTVWVAEK